MMTHVHILSRVRTLAIAIALVALMLATSAQSGDTSVGPTLDAGRIEAALTNGASEGVNSYDNPYTVWFLPGGRLDGVAGVDDEYVDSGQWWLEDDYFCRSWNTWLNGETGCFQVVIDGETIYWLDHLDKVTREEHYSAPQ
ncbi:MAG: hypothetical protein P8Q36_20015 [Alphaproteobacteria bacterium]|jgi:hypothetical protein|nr:hypothetical protein [Rhodospirillaceae bacterium]MDG2483129.1 hypothetical protein [Alphaproteobacteria bacterium]MBT6202743.1 hypothetical protein [Rhodospirillaceae bacterium]MBT6512553.1 hypothetical protein [Rhodospirillaceae bacterium]MBT7615223.1 hypothetical protein [Rhodospirillaceae bacterium]